MQVSMRYTFKLSIDGPRAAMVAIIGAALDAGLDASVTSYADGEAALELSVDGDSGMTPAAAATALATFLEDHGLR